VEVLQSFPVEKLSAGIDSLTPPQVMNIIWMELQR
jgi:hypothetical protein